MQSERAPVVLAADVGGTNARLGLYRRGGGAPQALRVEVVASRSAASLAQLLAAFVGGAGSAQLAGACVAIAGPVVDDAVDVTNLPWRVDRSELAEALALPRLRLVNDLEAAALGMQDLPEADFEILQAGDRSEAGGNVAVVAAGTGFGEAVLVWDGERHHPCSTEAGHTSFAPRDEQDLPLWRELRERHGHVSLERVVSGPGLVAIHAWLRRESGAPVPAALAARIAAGDASAAIAEAGLGGEDRICVAALSRFAQAYGAAAGDAALRHLCLGGVMLAGGIAPKILPALRDPAFLEAFRDKGRFAPLLARLRVAVCLAPNPTLEGAARLALRSVSGAGGR